MIYKKPKDAIEYWNEYRNVWKSNALAEFLDSLPDSFEIVEPGNVQVKWPEGLTKERLEQFATWNNAVGNYAARDALRALAAIAPEEKKKRKVTLYERDDKLLGKVRVWGYKSDLDLQPGWREVGECEVDA